MRFEYAKGFGQAVPVNVAMMELNRIVERDGGIKPGAVVEGARPADAPLHAVFEWDNTEAAELYRHEQARQLVRAVVLVPQPEKREQTPIVRAFVSVYTPDGPNAQTRHYRPTLEVLSEPAAAEEVRRRFLSELLNLRRRYLDLIELSEDMSGAMNTMVGAAS